MCDCRTCGRHWPCTNENCTEDQCEECAQVMCDHCGKLMDEGDVLKVPIGKFCSDYCCYTYQLLERR